MNAKDLIEEMINCNIFITVNYKDIARIENSNDYSYIANASKKNGIYIFYKINNSSKEYLYIGENHKVTEKTKDTRKWDLRERIRQHFVETDTGSLLKKIAEKNGISARDAKEKFIDDDIKLSYLPIDNNNENNIVKFQDILIEEIKPKYND